MPRTGGITEEARRVCRAEPLASFQSGDERRDERRGRFGPKACRYAVVYRRAEGRKIGEVPHRADAEAAS
jgi:hypothetical protein